jgi:two-component system sensor histidine kinase AlgZ
LSPWLQRQSYRRGCVWVLLLVWLAVTLVWRQRDGVQVQPDRYLALLLLSGGVSWLLLEYFRLRQRALSPLLTEARLQALQARIRPHFLFNSINAVLSLIRSEPLRAERGLEDLADLFRVFMADNVALSTLQREVALTRQYLALEALRLGERLVVLWHTDNMPANAYVPPLVLQPLVENAVYHGIEPRSAPGQIEIHLYRSGAWLHVVVKNPYQPHGGDHHAGNKMAMGNIRERLNLHFDTRAQLATRVGADYYQVHITLPYLEVRA